MERPILFDGFSMDIRVIGKTNAVLTAYENDEYVCQVNIRKINNKWKIRVKKPGKRLRLTNNKWQSPRNGDLELIEKVENYIKEKEIEEILLS